MFGKFFAAAVFAASSIAANAQGIDAKQPPTPLVLCPDGSDPQITGMGCPRIEQRNAIDEGMASPTLPQRTRPITVPNDPLGDAGGNARPFRPSTGFGNPAIQMPNLR